MIYSVNDNKSSVPPVLRALIETTVEKSYNDSMKHAAELARDYADEMTRGVVPVCNGPSALRSFAAVIEKALALKREAEE